MYLLYFILSWAKVFLSNLAQQHLRQRCYDQEPTMKSQTLTLQHGDVNVNDNKFVISQFQAGQQNYFLIERSRSLLTVKSSPGPPGRSYQH